MELRNKNIKACQEEVQDCLIIGAGINGAVSAAALSGKGARVTIVDKGDFAALTSQESSNLAWGGIKYLENAELLLVWKLCGCRNELMDLYPSQVEEIRFLTCIPKGFRKPWFLVYLGGLLYWGMGRFRTRPPVLKTRSAIARETLLINSTPLTGGMEYSDCLLVENDARFTFGFILKTLAHGGRAINYLELISAERREDGLWHLGLLDAVSGQQVFIQSRALINAAGPLADRINVILGIESEFRHLLSKGVHLIVPQVSAVRRVMAFFASDGRLFFMIPMGTRTCIGTTDLRVEEANVKVQSEDVEFILENANQLLNLENPLSTHDIIATRCGVRPLVTRLSDASFKDGDWTSLSRKHEVYVDQASQMLTIYGGKLTDCINVGNEVADLIGSFGIFLSEPGAIWYGEPGKARKKAFQETAEESGIPEPSLDNLWRRYGEDAFAIVERIRENPAMGEILVGDYLRAEFYHVATSEMVVCLEDFLRRRSMLSLVTWKEELRQDPGLKEAVSILFGDLAEKEWEKYFS